MRRLVPTLLVFVCLLTRGATCVRPHLPKSRADDSCTPQQVHVALTDSPSELRVSWSTRRGGCESSIQYFSDDECTSQQGEGAASAVPPVPVGVASGREKVLRNADMCTAPARDYDYPPTPLHSVVLTGLRPGRCYLYQIAGAWDRVHFRAPTPPSASSRLRFVVYGDMGESKHRVAKSPGAEFTARAVLREAQRDSGLDLVLHVGDLSYANGRLEVWDTFMESIEPVARAVPYMVVAGNHEYDYERGGRGGGDRTPDASGEVDPYSPEWGNYGNDSGGECGVAISARFVMPGGRLGETAAGGANDSAPSNDMPHSLDHTQQQQQQSVAGEGGKDGAGRHTGWWPHHPSPNPPFWFTFTAGPVTFVALSTEHSVAAGTQQRQWLEAVLRGVDRCSSPWLVVAMHRPMYVPFPHKSNRIVGEHLQGELEDLLSASNVDLVVSGHVHSYYRTCSVLREECRGGDGGGVPHVVIGSGGKRLSLVCPECDQPRWLERGLMEYGFGLVTVESDGSLLFEFVSSEDSEVLDSVELRRPKADRANCAAEGLALDGLPLTHSSSAAHTSV